MERISAPYVEKVKNSFVGSGDSKTDFSFILSKKLREQLGAFAKLANSDGRRVVRWTDILESAVSKLNEGDILELKARRTMELQSK